MFLLMFCPSKLTGQDRGIRVIRLKSAPDSIFLDSNAVAAGSIIVRSAGELVQKGAYALGPFNNILYPDSALKGKPLEITYRILYLPPARTYSHKSRDMIEPVFTRDPRSFYDYSKSDNQQNLFGDGLSVFGNIARGIGFGNNQDLVLNSNLNLQLNGDIGKGVIIRAVISDENNPIQPQGNTQQIQDFDKVYVSVIKDSSSLTVGDFLMNSSGSQYFMKYYKKSRGLRMEIMHPGSWQQRTVLNGAVSRGRFARNEIQGQEGVQGPYRLTGENGELNIIIISGTENIYMDGERLERGQQNDYVIDYNTGELYFMPGKLINRYSRIIAEFQYSDRNYARTVFTAGHEARKGGWGFSANYFSEQDNKQQPADTTGKDQVRTLLENAGDGIALYNYENEYQTLQPDRINYRKTDSLGYSIYVYTDNPASDTVFYTLSFSYTGEGKGNYVQIASAANGRVFAWVEPAGGVPRGNYEPSVVLIPPKRLQMLTSQLSYRTGKSTELKLEGAYSNNNINTYSQIDKYNDDGAGLFFSFRSSDYKIQKTTMSLQAKMEYVSRNFKYVERYRDVEFMRIWNRRLDNSVLSGTAPELISTLGVTLNRDNRHVLAVEASSYNRTSLMNGLRGKARYTYESAKTRFSVYHEDVQVSSRMTGFQSLNRTYASGMEAVYKIKKIQIGASAGTEQSVFRTDTGNLMNPASFRYEQMTGFIESAQEGRVTYRIDAQYRADYLPGGADFRYISTGTNLNGKAEFRGKKFNRLAFTGSYRLLNESSGAPDDEVLLGRMEYGASFFKRVLQLATYYQVGTGREQKRQFSYAPVQAGNGTHSWNDYNGNGIEELNEFEPAVFKDQARYVKVFIPGNEFIKSNSNEFNQTVRLQAPQKWQSGNSLERFLARFNTITAYKADRKITDNSLLTIMNPFRLNVDDTALISVSSLAKQTTFFNRSGSRFGLEHNLQTGNSKQFLYSGFESRETNRQQFIVRSTFNRSFNLVAELEDSRKINRNNYFENRNYGYRSRKWRPELFYQTIKGIRLGAYYAYTEAGGMPGYSGETAFIGESGLEARYFIIGKGNIDARLAMHRISFKGEPNSPLAFDLLNGLANGRNLTWNIGIGGKTKGNIQITVSYEGRKTEIGRTIHNGRAEARYIF